MTPAPSALRTQVARVSHAIGHEQEATLVHQEIIELNGLESIGFGVDTLVTFGTSVTIEASARNQLHGNALTASLFFDLVQDGRRLQSVGHVDLANVATTSE